MNKDPTPEAQPERIDMESPQDRATWAKKLDASEEQLKEAVGAVGDRATDVEMHLKGTRSTTNADRVHDLAAGGKPR